jgi:cell division protein FtsL
MTVASLTHSNVVRPTHSNYRISAGQKNKTKKLVVNVLLFSIFVCSLLYVFATTNIVAQGYKIRNLSKQVNESESTNKGLQVEVSNLKSINMLEAKSIDLQMVKAQKIEYVSLPGTSAMLVK